MDYTADPNDFANELMSGAINPNMSPAPTASPGMGAGGTGLAIGAGLGLLQALGNQNAYKAKMNQLATTTRYSPWTHMNMAQPTAPNALGPILGYGASGASLAQGLDNNNLNRQYYPQNMYAIGGGY